MAVSAIEFQIVFVTCVFAIYGVVCVYLMDSFFRVQREIRSDLNSIITQYAELDRELRVLMLTFEKISKGG